MQRVEATSPYAEQVIRIDHELFLLGDLFQHYQHQLTAREEGVTGLRCIGYSRQEVAMLVVSTPDRVRQWERQSVNHMILLYQQGK